ncbi:FKBP-type peptidyl-prolyl cis-trans isomerase [Alteraurantiacibacter aquimixticola]|uniref:Peptidyl-prolyl cis-trans isomerase n=1 Tax=Alteraurantiacibacter aquimixticola TaxID=2489173 RepID=A0A4T3F4P5_9SPHN|nr:FKBP-type peptidyl-prolyl cis-trans isomerase [Alteraurantiacibacter aquimixticola]TIX51761.1 FKBP-type peptidyl-prolyl cis-trans isomerase [Alteraurantiacibacter aquimixticola]
MKHATLIAAMAALTLALPANAQDEEAFDIAQSSEWFNQQQAALAALTPADGWSTLEGGVKFRRTGGDGTGPAPTVRDIVTVHYTGKLTNGEEFDSSRGGDPATFPLARLVPAWQVAIPYMGVGDTAEIMVPAEMGYGPRGAGPIPPAATLFFEIELIDIMVPPG